MKRFRYLLVPAAALMLAGVGSAAHAERYSLSFSSPGVFIHYGSGYGHYGHWSHKRRYYSSKRYHRGYPSYWHGPRHGHKHYGHKHYGHKHYGYKHYGYKHYGHKRHGYRHPGRYHGRGHYGHWRHGHYKRRHGHRWWR